MIVRPELGVELALVLRDHRQQRVVGRGAWRLGEFAPDFGFRTSRFAEGACLLTALLGVLRPRPSRSTARRKPYPDGRVAPVRRSPSRRRLSKGNPGAGRPRAASGRSTSDGPDLVLGHWSLVPCHLPVALIPLPGPSLAALGLSAPVCAGGGSGCARFCAFCAPRSGHPSVDVSVLVILVLN